MSNRLLVVLLLGFMAICAGCSLPPSPRATFMQQMRDDYARWGSNFATWQKDWEKNRQDVNDCLAEYESTLGQETSLLESLGNDEQIQPADFHLYKDFLLFIAKSDDQIKVYEYIERMRTVLPADRMEIIEKLYHQQEQNESKLSSLQKQTTVLKERAGQLHREKEALARRGDRYIQLRQLSY